ncbi:unnamed protein product [Ectocarpus sp. CCAP 1310/34]|nr:unnamed protein product [Ectocarpus sp. CCAP 1310/34]
MKRCGRRGFSVKAFALAQVGVAVSGVWGNMGFNGGCLRKSKTADVSLLV